MSKLLRNIVTVQHRVTENPMASMLDKKIITSASKGNVNRVVKINRKERAITNSWNIHFHFYLSLSLSTSEIKLFRSIDIQKRFSTFL